MRSSMYHFWRCRDSGHGSMYFGTSDKYRRISRSWTFHSAIAVFLLFPIVLSAALASGASSKPTHATLGAIGSPELTKPALAGLGLGIEASPPVVCANGGSNCTEGLADSQVTLSAKPIGVGPAAWPAVQVLFALETSPFDGSYIPGTPGAYTDPCVSAHQPYASALCGEANGIPFFVSNAGTIASYIQMGHPGSNVTFALVDFGATIDNWDDSNGAVHNTLEWSGHCPPYPCNPYTSNWDSSTVYEYHVDIGTFVPAQDFQSAVEQTFQKNLLSGGYAVPGANLSDNFLHASSITALYGALTGQGVSWSNSTHHVIVWIGSTAPRDPSYLQNYCVTTNTFAASPALNYPGYGDDCLSNDTLYESPSCEPAYNFSAGRSPNCEGWITSQDGAPADSIAALSQNAPDCLGSLGRSCTIDMVDLYAMPTDPNSPSWSSPVALVGCTSNCNNMSTAGSWWVTTDVHRVISAACDLANATGGTWAGPVIDSCGPGRGGSLLFVSPGNSSPPTTANPTLLDALAQVGFGAPPSGLLFRAVPGLPVFEFVPWGGFHVDLGAPAWASCISGASIPTDCDSLPWIRTISGVETLSWNWSSNANLDVLYAGDVWTATFFVYDLGPPYAIPYPVDSCVTASCLAAGSGPVGQSFSSGNAMLTDGAPFVASFPYVNVTVVLPQGTPPSNSGPPPPPPTGGGPPVLNPSPLPVIIPQPSIVASGAVASVISLQAIAAGVLAAGFSRVAIRPKAVRMPVPIRQPTGQSGSKFDKERSDSLPAGRFE